MNQHTQEILNDYERQNQILKTHWIWSVFHTPPGDFDAIIQRLKKRIIPVTAGLSPLRAQFFRGQILKAVKT